MIVTVTEIQFNHKLMHTFIVLKYLVCLIIKYSQLSYNEVLSGNNLNTTWCLNCDSSLITWFPFSVHSARTINEGGYPPITWNFYSEKTKAFTGFETFKSTFCPSCAQHIPIRGVIKVITAIFKFRDLRIFEFRIFFFLFMLVHMSVASSFLIDKKINRVLMCSSIFYYKKK